MLSTKIRDAEVWSTGKAKIYKEFETIVIAGDLDAAVVSYQRLVKTSFPLLAHEQFAILLVEKLKLSAAEIFELCKPGGVLYPDDQAHHHLRECLIQEILICAVGYSTRSYASDIFDLFDLIFAEENLVPDTYVFSLCAKAAEVSSEIGDKIIEKLRKSRHWSPTSSLYIRAVQGDCSLLEGESKQKLTGFPFVFREIIQLSLALHHRSQNVQFFDKLIRTCGPFYLYQFGFEYLVDCVLSSEKRLQLQFFFTRANNTNLVQMFVDEVKIGNHHYLNTFHSDFETIDALCPNVDVDSDACKPTLIDRLFPKELLSADDSLLRLSVRNRNFTLQGDDGEERLSRIKLIIEDLRHTLRLSGKLITPLCALTLHYF